MDDAVADGMWRVPSQERVIVAHGSGGPRRTDAATAVSGIGSGQRVLVGSGAAEPEALVEAMAARADALRDVRVLHIYTLGVAPYVEPGMEHSFRHVAFFVGDNVRAAVHEGRADLVPIHLHQVPSLFDRVEPLDWVLVQVSPPDRHGMCTVGVSADIVTAALRTGARAVAEVNPQMPRTHGNCHVPVERFEALVDVDRPLREVAPPPADEVSRRIGEHVAGLVRDGDCLQVGIGAIPNAVLGALTGHRHLGIHTEALTDGVVDLVEAGAVDNSRKAVKNGRSVCSFVLGTRRLYDFVDDNPAVALHGSDYVNDPEIIARIDDMVAVNSAIQVDLTGQVDADSVGSAVYSGFGGQVDFIRGASRSRRGRPVIALPSTAKGGSISRLVPCLAPGAGVVTTRADVHHVVTEFGVADLFGRPLRERVEALLAIAHPDHRDELERGAKAMGLLR